MPASGMDDLESGRNRDQPRSEQVVAADLVDPGVIDLALVRLLSLSAHRP